MRRKLLLTAAALALVGTLSFSGSDDGAQAQNTLHECFAAPADYVAEFDLVDGISDGKVSYPEPRVFLEAQGHVRPPGVEKRHHMEHVHTGLCFPYAEVIKQPNDGRTLDIRYVFHNVSNYTITKANSNWVVRGGSGQGHHASAAQIAELQAAMDASAGGQTTKVFHHYTMTGGTIGTNCRRTVKLEMQIVAANENAVVNRWLTGGQFTTYIDYPENTKTCTPEFGRDQIRARDWVPDPNMGYIYSIIFPAVPASQMDDPVAEPWPVEFRANGMFASIHVDPDFHAPDNPGIWSVDKGRLGVETFHETIPTDTLPDGLHRLVYVGDRRLPSLGDIGHGALIVMPFTVPGSTCEEQVAALEAEVARLNDIIDRAALVLAER